MTGDGDAWQMDDKEYTDNIAAVVTAKTEPDKRLAQEVARAWGEICSKPAELKFDRRHVLAAAVETIPKAELLAFMDQFIVAGSPQRAKLAVHVVSAKFAEEYAADPRGSNDGVEEAEAPAEPEPDGKAQEENEDVGEPELSEPCVISAEQRAVWKAMQTVYPAMRVESDGQASHTY